MQSDVDKLRGQMFKFQVDSYRLTSGEVPQGQCMSASGTRTKRDIAAKNGGNTDAQCIFVPLSRGRTGTGANADNSQQTDSVSLHSAPNLQLLKAVQTLKVHTSLGLIADHAQTFVSEHGDEAASNQVRIALY